jgi:Lanthionine synthetase C-like protein/Protein kinase domain
MAAGATHARGGPPRGGSGAPGEFAARLRALGVMPYWADPWLMVGKPTRAAAWKLHLSATVGAVDSLFERVLPCLARHGAHFKIVAARDGIVQLSAGNFGEAQIGKVITVYPRNDTEAVALARELIEHTRGIVGPRVATDLHLGEAVYARYGAVRPRVLRDRLGEPTELIPDGSGNWVPDLRAVPFSCPQGITNPFPTAGQTEAPGRPRLRELLAGRYFVTDVVRAGIAGSVLRAIDLHGVRGPVAYVLKQARPHCSEDALGRDCRARLRHEAAVLARLRGLAGITSAAEYFEDEDTGYLPIAYVPGQTLAELVYRLLSGRSWLYVRQEDRRRLLRYAAQLVRRVNAAHARGVIHRDISPTNVWIGDDDRVHLLDWECAHVVGSRIPAFQLGTPGYSDLSHERRAPQHRDDWRACGRVLVFMLTGLDAAAVVHGRPRELASRLAQLTELRSGTLMELLAGTLADRPAGELDATTLLAAIASTARSRKAPHRHSAAPLFTTATHESVLTEGVEKLTASFRVRLDQLQIGRAREADMIDVHAGIAGLLYVLAAAHGAGVAHLDKTLGERAVRLLIARKPVTPDLPGLVHGRAGRALAVAAAAQAGCVAANEALRMHLADALPGRLDWPDFTHGAAGQGSAALACARRLAMPELAAGAAACADYLVRTQSPEGAWRLPEGAAGASGERYTGFAHGAAGMMGFLASYAALTNDAAADAAWRRAEAWLVSRAVRGRAGRCHWPQSDSNPARPNWWCHGAPGIALGWLCVAQAQGMAAIAEEHLRGALAGSPQKLRSDNLCQCHGLAGIGEVYLEAHRVLGQECWRERAADIANVLVALFRRRSPQPWQHPRYERAADADGLMIGTAGIMHFLLRHRYPAVITSPPLLA